MSRPAFSLVIPTIGRPTLANLLSSIPPFDPEFQTVLIGDSYNDDFTAAVAQHRAADRHTNTIWRTHDGGVHAWGHPQRNYGMQVAQGQWLGFSQDDNVWSPDAFGIIVQAIASQPHPRPLLFKVLTWQAGVVWSAPRLAEGDIDADCIVVPNIPEKLGVWAPTYNGDFDFIKQTYDLWAGDVVWCDALIACALPNIPHFDPR